MLEKYRKEIDKIDGELGKKLLERVKVIKKIAKYKNQHSLDTRDQRREKLILKRFKSPFQRAIFKEILEQSREIQNSQAKSQAVSLKKKV